MTENKAKNKTGIVAPATIAALAFVGGFGTGNLVTGDDNTQPGETLIRIDTEMSPDGRAEAQRIIEAEICPVIEDGLTSGGCSADLIVAHATGHVDFGGGVTTIGVQLDDVNGDGSPPKRFDVKLSPAGRAAALALIDTELCPAVDKRLISDGCNAELVVEYAKGHVDFSARATKIGVQLGLPDRRKIMMPES